MTLTEKSLNTLELPAVLEMLAAEAVSPGAKESAMELRPTADMDEAKRWIEETTAAHTMMVLRSSPGFSGVKDVRSSLRRAEAGGMLNTRELTAIADVLRNARTAIAYSVGDKTDRQPTAIDYLFNGLRANRYFEDKINSSITGDDELSDNASPELADIRRKMRAASDRVRQSLQKVITSPSYAKALQEPIITMKNGRYVVPVKAEQKSAVAGLVHDVSSSGATLFIEPMSAVKANNEIRELMAREKNEIERILMALSAEAASFAGEIDLDYKLLTQLDLIFAKAKLSYKLNCSVPALSDRGEIFLRRARHPLLPKGTAVPIDVHLGGDYDTLVITGPNTGGKTVTIKTIGLLCLMAACGLHLPADDGSTVPVYDKVLSDIGDEQSINQSLSTFSSHMTNIVGILDECDERSLILLDELGAGTDPTEGAALAVAIIEYARAHGAAIAATTHYAELKIYAMTTPGVMNASCEFDIKTLRPTYRLLLGIPGKSNAFAISTRLGLPQEIIEDAQRRMERGDAEFEAAITHLEEAREEAELRRIEMSRLQRQAEDKLKEAEKLRSEAEKERDKYTKSAKRDAAAIIAQAREQAEKTYRELNDMRKAAAAATDWQAVNAARAAMMHDLNDAEDALREHEDRPIIIGENRPAAVGDTVQVISIGARAEVTAINPDGSLQLQAGMMKLTAKQEEVQVIKAAAPKKKPAPAVTRTMTSGRTASQEIDLRGMMAEEAVSEAERFLDFASMRHIETVTLIHGKGTGVLRQAVQQMLKRNPLVKSFRLGRYGEGETGVTIVELK